MDAPAAIVFQYHILAAVKKNLLIKWRQPVASILEIVLPPLLLLGLVIAWALADIEHRPAQNFVPPPPAVINMTLPSLFESVCCAPNETVNGLRICNQSELAIGTRIAHRLLPVDSIYVLPPGPRAILDAFLNFSLPRYVPTMDEMILIQWIAKATLPDVISVFNYLTPEVALICSGKLHFIPNNHETRRLVSAWNASSKLLRYVVGGFFPTSSAANEYTKQLSQEGFTWGFIEATQLTEQKLDVTIHLNRSGLPWSDHPIDEYWSGGLGSHWSRNYFATGFLTLQQSVMEYYRQAVLNWSEPLPTPAIVAMPFAAYENNEFLDVAGEFAPLPIVLSVLFMVSQLTRAIVEEKEQRIRETMLVMGLSRISFYASWMLLYMFLAVATSLLMVMMLKLTILRLSELIVIYILILLFCISCVCLAVLLSSFFSRTKLAASLAPVLFFILSIPSLTVQDPSKAAAWLLAPLSPSMFAIGIRLLCSHEKIGGFHFAEFTSSDQFNMASVWFFLAVDSVAYTLLAIYFDAVLPSEWGARQHPLFCLIEPWRWCFRSTQQSAKTEDSREGVFESQCSSTPPTIVANGLVKAYKRHGKTITAVDNLCLTMFENQIHVLVGHNGSGKSSVMEILTGLVAPDKGDCTVFGVSLRNSASAIRQRIGYCPQHNIIWPMLTCMEHLDFFSQLKGLNAEQRCTTSTALLQSLGLWDKANAFASSLSGGQKRRLSVAIALAGGAPLIMLDEPTAGMDVAARRRTWDLLRSMCAGRTIILTTHYMDEADVLGHTVSVLSHGHLKCSGSPVFLKSRLGVGYSLTLSVPHEKRDAIVEYVRGQVPEATEGTADEGALAFRLPMCSVPRFPHLLRGLEHSKDEFGIERMGIRATTLEEIFFRIGHEEERLPTENSASDGEIVENELTPPHDDAPTSLPINEEGSVSTAQVNAACCGWARQFTRLLIKRFHCARRDKRALCLQLIVPVVCITLALSITMVRIPELPRLVLSQEMFFEEKVQHEMGNCSLDVMRVFQRTPIYTYPPTNISICDPTADALDSLSSRASNLSEFLQKTFFCHPYLRMTSMFCLDSSIVPTPSAILFENTSARHAAPLALQEYLSSAILATTNNNNTVPTLTMASQALHFSTRESAFIASISALMVALLIIVPYSFMPSSVVGWIVKERECKAKHLQLLSGMDFRMYWAANFLFDFVCFSITIFLMLMIFLAYTRTEYIGDEETTFAITVLFELYALSGVAASYLSSFAFDNHSTAQNITMIGNFTCGFLLVILVWFMDYFDALKNLATILRFVFRVVPVFCLGDGLLSVSAVRYYRSLLINTGPFRMNVTGWGNIYMAIEFPLFMAATLLLDHPQRKRKAQLIFHDPDKIPDPIPDEDRDVAEERRIVERQDRMSDAVQVVHLCKVYPCGHGPQIAVRNLSFGVQQHEIFAFLGTNGAGKTTTVSVLCGEVLPTHGRAKIMGHDVVNDAEEAQQHIGYCPQPDALFENMTPEEHLWLYAGIRGVVEISATVGHLVKSCGLEKRRDVVVGNLSCGDRRKLSVAISLVGSPSVVFLDEPTVGMDPIARHALWATIRSAAARSSIVFTSHYLEEVEELAHRISVMVGGVMKCIGTRQALREKYGSGFEISLRLGDESRIAGLRSYVVERIQEATLVETNGNRFTFSVPQCYPLSQLFQMLEAGKAFLGITDYSIAPASLEQLFLRVSEATTVDCGKQEIS